MAQVLPGGERLLRAEGSSRQRPSDRAGPGVCQQPDTALAAMQGCGPGSEACLRPANLQSTPWDRARGPQLEARFSPASSRPHAGPQPFPPRSRAPSSPCWSFGPRPPARAPGLFGSEINVALTQPPRAVLCWGRGEHRAGGAVRAVRAVRAVGSLAAPPEGASSFLPPAPSKSRARGWRPAAPLARAVLIGSAVPLSDW